jgi:hypothetical protein
MRSLAAAGPPLAALGRPRSQMPLLALSFVLTSVFPLWGKTPFADLSNKYTDHVRQTYATWVFLYRGLAMYWLPLGEAAAGIDYPQAIDQWLQVPYVYPPGAFAVFLPLACLGEWVPMSQHSFAQVGILYLLLLSHGALYVMLRTLAFQPAGGRRWVAVVAWLVLMRLGLNGQYDGVWLACGALAALRMGQGRPADALSWIALSALLHYRAILLAPLGFVALLEVVRGTPWRRWPWASFLFVAGVGGVCLWTFARMTPGAIDGGAATPSLLSDPWSVRVGLILLITLVAAAVALRGADALVASLVLLGGALAFIDTHHWWHAAMLLLVPLGVGALRAPRWPTLTRVTLVLWLSLLQHLAWGGNPLWLFGDATRYVRLQG